MSLYLKHGDCLEIMKKIPDNSIDMILCDLPYGTTQNKWDSVIPFEELWKQYWRIAKKKAAVVLTAQCPFDKILGVSQISYLKYEWIWYKSRPSGHLNAKKQPMKSHENVLVFYREQCTYNPIMQIGKKNHVNEKPRKAIESDNYGKQSEVVEKITTEKYPTSIQPFTVLSPTNVIHPTQKPVALMEYLIKTYTNEGDLVLDNCMGSGTTGIACINTNRKFFGIELDEKYFNLAKNRIEEHKASIS
jgi:DNA modification methylase